MSELFDSEMKVSEAKKLLMQEIMEYSGSCKCPVCDRHAQVYARTITRSMAQGLQIIYSLPENEMDQHGFFHLEKVMKKYSPAASIRGDVPKLRFWGLIEKHGTDDGYYRVTTKGDQFVEGLIEVEKTLYIFNDKVQARSEETINFELCVKGNRFKLKDIVNTAV